MQNYNLLSCSGSSLFGGGFVVILCCCCLCLCVCGLFVCLFICLFVCCCFLGSGEDDMAFYTNSVINVCIRHYKMLLAYPLVITRVPSGDYSHTLW